MQHAAAGRPKGSGGIALKFSVPSSDTGLAIANLAGPLAGSLKCRACRAHRLFMPLTTASSSLPINLAEGA
jgi:hypothetical protein